MTLDPLPELPLFVWLSPTRIPFSCYDKPMPMVPVCLPLNDWGDHVNTIGRPLYEWYRENGFLGLEQIPDDLIWEVDQWSS